MPTKKREWNVMTRTRKGVVSLMKNLTEEEARGLMQRLRHPLARGDPWNINSLLYDERRRRISIEQGHGGSFGGGIHMCQDGDLEQIECWGPPDRQLEVWPKPADFDEKWAEALAALGPEPVAPPPPEPTPPRAPQLGLPEILPIAPARKGWRCAECRKVQNGEGAWIPDSTLASDSRTDLIATCEAQRWNGHNSLWCLPCCSQWRAR